LLTGFRDGSLRLPRAAVSSQHIDQLMRELGGNVLVDSFAQLPIPFQAVATDLLTGDAYVFDHGDLAIAQRASMAVPGLFEPVELDGRLLVDGGMARQLPVENLQGPNGCADVIIAIDVGTPSLKREDIRSFVDVLANMCLSQRIADEETLRREVEANVRERSAKAIPIKWKFSTQDARRKLARLYPRVST
jgi:NTE family protein